MLCELYLGVLFRVKWNILFLPIPDAVVISAVDGAVFQYGLRALLSDACYVASNAANIHGQL